MGHDIAKITLLINICALAGHKNMVYMHFYFFSAVLMAAITAVWGRRCARQDKGVGVIGIVGSPSSAPCGMGDGCHHVLHVHTAVGHAYGICFCKIISSVLFLAILYGVENYTLIINAL